MDESSDNDGINQNDSVPVIGVESKVIRAAETD
jgi:hypothetical protein